jgi:hypothetical protein
MLNHYTSLHTFSLGRARARDVRVLGKGPGRQIPGKSNHRAIGNSPSGNIICFGLCVHVCIKTSN